MQSSIKHAHISMMIQSRYTGAYAGFLKGGGPNFKNSEILDIHAAKGYAPPPRKFLKMVQFRAF